MADAQQIRERFEDAAAVVAPARAHVADHGDDLSGDETVLVARAAVPGAAGR